MRYVPGPSGWGANKPSGKNDLVLLERVPVFQLVVLHAAVDASDSDPALYSFRFAKEIIKHHLYPILAPGARGGGTIQPHWRNFLHVRDGEVFGGWPGKFVQ